MRQFHRTNKSLSLKLREVFLLLRKQNETILLKTTHLSEL